MFYINKFVTNQDYFETKMLKFDIYILIGLSALSGGLFLLYGPAIPMITTGSIVMLFGIIGHSRIPRMVNR